MLRRWLWLAAFLAYVTISFLRLCHRQLLLLRVPTPLRHYRTVRPRPANVHFIFRFASATQFVGHFWLVFCPGQSTARVCCVYDIYCFWQKDFVLLVPPSLLFSHLVFFLVPLAPQEPLNFQLTFQSRAYLCQSLFCFCNF